MSKGLKIGLGVGLIVIVLVVLYFLLRSTPKKKNSDTPYSDNIPADQYADFWGAVYSLFGKDPGTYIGNNQGTYESLTRGYLKKNGLAATANNVNLYSSEITGYVNAPGSLPHFKI